MNIIVQKQSNKKEKGCSNGRSGGNKGEEEETGCVKAFSFSKRKRNGGGLGEEVTTVPPQSLCIFSPQTSTPPQLISISFVYCLQQPWPYSVNTITYSTKPSKDRSKASGASQHTMKSTDGDSRQRVMNAGLDCFGSWCVHVVTACEPKRRRNRCH